MNELRRFPKETERHGVKTTTDIFKIHRQEDSDAVEVQVHDKTCKCPNGHIECAAYRAFYWYWNKRTIDSDGCIAEAE